MKRLFIILSFIGIIVIGILSFVLPTNPYEIIPAMTVISFDKPLWLCILVGGGFIYLVIIWTIYDMITGDIKRFCNES